MKHLATCFCIYFISCIVTAWILIVISSVWGLYILIKGV